MLAEAGNKTRSYRRWSPDERKAIVEESYAPNANVSAVARKHGVSAVSLYLWRKELAGATEVASDPFDPAEVKSPTTTDEGAPNASDGAERLLEPEFTPFETREQAVRRVKELERQLHQLQADLAYSRRQRTLLVGVLTSIGSQLRLLAELEDNADHGPQGHDHG